MRLIANRITIDGEILATGGGGSGGIAGAGGAGGGSGGYIGLDAMMLTLGPQAQIIATGWRRLQSGDGR